MQPHDKKMMNAITEAMFAFRRDEDRKISDRVFAFNARKEEIAAEYNAAVLADAAMIGDYELYNDFYGRPY